MSNSDEENIRSNQFASYICRYNSGDRKSLLYVVTDFRFTDATDCLGTVHGADVLFAIKSWLEPNARDISKIPIGQRVIEDAKESSKHGMQDFGLYDKLAFNKTCMVAGIGETWKVEVGGKFTEAVPETFDYFAGHYGKECWELNFRLPGGEAFHTVRAVTDFGKLGGLHPPKGLERRFIDSVHYEELPVVYRK